MVMGGDRLSVRPIIEAFNAIRSDSVCTIYMYHVHVWSPTYYLHTVHVGTMACTVYLV